MLFFEKNKIDLSLGSQVSISVTDAIASSTGSDYVDYLRNRSNDSGWATTDSTDAALTQLDILFGESRDIDTLFALRQNFKAYTCQYALAAGALTDFSIPVNVAGNAEPDKYHRFDLVSADRLRLIVAGTFVADDDKFCAQLIATKCIGQLATIQPRITKLEVSRNRRRVRVLSGKSRVQRNIGSVGFTIKKPNVTSGADLTLLENLHEYYDGFLVWPNADADNSLPVYAPKLNARTFWRRRDIYLMNVASELSPEWNDGRYANGMDVDVDLVEVV